MNFKYPENFSKNSITTGFLILSLGVVLLALFAAGIFKNLLILHYALFLGCLCAIIGAIPRIIRGFKYRETGYELDSTGFKIIHNDGFKTVIKWDDIKGFSENRRSFFAATVRGQEEISKYLENFSEFHELFQKYARVKKAPADKKKATETAKPSPVSPVPETGEVRRISRKTASARGKAASGTLETSSSNGQIQADPGNQISSAAIIKELFSTKTEKPLSDKEIQTGPPEMESQPEARKDRASVLEEPREEIPQQETQKDGDALPAPEPEPPVIHLRTEEKDHKPSTPEDIYRDFLSKRLQASEQKPEATETPGIEEMPAESLPKAVPERGEREDGFFSLSGFTSPEPRALSPEESSVQQTETSGFPMFIQPRPAEQEPEEEQKPEAPVFPMFIPPRPAGQEPEEEQKPEVSDYMPSFPGSPGMNPFNPPRPEAKKSPSLQEEKKVEVETFLKKYTQMIEDRHKSDTPSRASMRDPGRRFRPPEMTPETLSAVSREPAPPAKIDDDSKGIAQDLRKEVIDSAVTLPPHGDRPEEQDTSLPEPEAPAASPSLEFLWATPVTTPYKGRKELTVEMILRTLSKKLQNLLPKK